LWKLLRKSTPSEMSERRIDVPRNPRCVTRKPIPLTAIFGIGQS